MTAGPSRFGIVGSGWRTQFYLRMAQVLPERLAVTGVVTRTPDRGAEVEREWGVATCRTVNDLLAHEQPEFVLVSVPWEVAPRVTSELVEHGVRVLCETPPAPDISGLQKLWNDVGQSGLVQVAEQYLMMPGHAARRAVVGSGAIGRVTSVQVSSTHLYHAVSMIRLLLDAGFGDVEVTARTATASLADPLSRDGWAGGTDPRPAATTIALLDFGDGRTGVYDFTGNQWFNPLRSNRIVVRGSAGELVDDRVVRLVDQATVVESPLVRRQTGIDLNLEGFDLDHISFEGSVVYRNPYQGCRLAEDDISVATITERMGAWCRDEGPRADGQGGRPRRKVSALVARMVAGADCVDDMALLRHGAMGRVFDRPYAPSTPASFLRTSPSVTCVSSKRSLPGSWRGWLRAPRCCPDSTRRCWSTSTT